MEEPSARGDFCVILTTTGSQEEARRLAELLVERRLAACVQMTGIASVYRWKEQVMREAEVLLLIKTSAHLYAQVEAAIVENHSYETPELLQLPVVEGLARYLDWITENCQPAGA
jgi:periplasmic divalent cation tolerance protein